MNLLDFLAIILICNTLCESYHILGIFPLPGKSHMAMFHKVMKGLAEAGHTVDVLSHFPQEKPIPRYNDISVRGTMPIFTNCLDIEMITSKLSYPNIVIDTNFSDLGSHICETLFNTSTLQQLKSTETKYDLIITEIFSVECFLGFRHIFKIPVVSLTSSVDLPWGSTRIGNPDNPSYIPNYYSHFTNGMNLLERITNTIQIIQANYKFSQAQASSNEIAKSFFGPDLPDLRLLAKQTNLILVNSHFSINYARPMVPNLIEVGGVHIDSPKPLANPFAAMFEEEKLYKGVIYFNMGSLVQSETFDKSKLEAILDTFAKLPYKVLWKSKKENMPAYINIPTNVYFESWLPQLDILCHPNLKLFISHGGLMGTQEAVYCGVPIMGIPFFADQRLNIKSLEKIGVALLMEYSSIPKEVFQNSVSKILENPNFEEKSKQLSLMFKDRPLSSLKTAIYWIEYVIRHKGALHLRSAGADLPWYQYYLLDIGCVCVTAALMVMYLTYCIFSYILMKFVYQHQPVNKFKLK